MSVVIKIDPFCTEESPQALHVHTEEDWAEARRAVQGAIRGGTSLLVAVHNPAMPHWFDSYRVYPEVTFTSCCPLELLAGALGVTRDRMPTALAEDPGAIVRSGLLYKAGQYPLRPGQSALSWVLENSLGPFWGLAKLAEPVHMNGLLRCCLTAEPPLGSDPTFILMRDEVVAAWCDEKPYGPLVRWLFEGDLSERARTIVLHALSLRYPREARTRAMQFEGRLGDLASLQDADQFAEAVDLRLCWEMEIPAYFSAALGACLRGFLDAKETDRIQECVSGYLREEMTIIEGHLQAHLSEIDSSWTPLLRGLAAVFRDTGNEGRKTANFLHSLLPAGTPSPLAADTPWDRVREWLEKEYFPFYDWCVRVDRQTDTAPHVGEFEAWLMNSYDDVSRTDGFHPFAVRRKLSALASRGPVLFVVVDGLSWIDSQRWKDLLSECGIACVESVMGVTTLPTITPVAKPSLMGGQLPGQLDNTEQSVVRYAEKYAQMLGLPMNDIAYAAYSEKSLASLLNSPKKAYLYMYNEVDAQLHKPHSPEQRRGAIMRLLRDLAEEIARAQGDFRKMFGQGLAVVTASDHGYTELGNTQGKRLNVPEEDGVRVVDGRVVWWRKQEDIPEASDFWRIDEGFLRGVDYRFYTARGYDYVNSRPRGATHGGLTPQEAVVAALVLDPLENAAYQPPTLVLSGTVRRGCPANETRLAVSNPNEAALEIREVSLRLTKPTCAMPVSIPAKATVELPCTVDAGAVRDPQLQITGFIQAGLKGRKGVQTPVRLCVQTTGAAVLDTDFENEFDL